MTHRMITEYVLLAVIAVLLAWSFGDQLITRKLRDIHDRDEGL